MMANAGRQVPQSVEHVVGEVRFDSFGGDADRSVGLHGHAGDCDDRLFGVPGELVAKMLANCPVPKIEVVIRKVVDVIGAAFWSLGMLFRGVVSHCSPFHLIMDVEQPHPRGV